LLRITAPNVDLDFRALRTNDIHFYYMKEMYSKPKNMLRVKLSKKMSEASVGELFLWHVASSVSPLNADGGDVKLTDIELKNIFAEMEYTKALDYIVSLCDHNIQKRNPGNHINWWNQNKIKVMLEYAGFSNILLSGYGQSYSPPLRNIEYFDNTHPKLSLYVEAFK
jgi:hypothetical protein